MTALRRTTVVWLLLLGLTLVACLESGRAEAGSIAAGAVLAATMVKAALIVSEYMEVREGPWWLQAACAAWVVAVSVVLGVLLLLG